MPDTLYLAIAERTSAQAAAQMTLPTYDPDYVLKLAKGDKPMPPDLRERIRSVVQLHIFSRKRLGGLDDAVALRREGILFLPDGQQLLDRTHEAEALARDPQKPAALRLQYLWIAMTGSFRLARPRENGAGSHLRYLENVCLLGEEMQRLADGEHGAHSVWFHLARVNTAAARYQLLAMRGRLDRDFYAQGLEVCTAAAQDCPWWVEVHRDALEYAALLGDAAATDRAFLALCRCAKTRPAGWVLSIAQQGMEAEAMARIRESALHRHLETVVDDDRRQLRAVSRIDTSLLDTLTGLATGAQ